KLQNAAHLEIVGENEAPIADAFAQYRRDPEWRCACGHVFAGRLRVGRVIHHHHRHYGMELSIRNQILIPNLLKCAINLWCFKMCIACCAAESREMLSASSDSMRREPRQKRAGIFDYFRSSCAG